MKKIIFKAGQPVRTPIGAYVMPESGRINLVYGRRKHTDKLPIEMLTGVQVTEQVLAQTISNALNEDMTAWHPIYEGDSITITF